jgi:transcriptional regulator GlxA family with amidase domain
MGGRIPGPAVCSRKTAERTTVKTIALAIFPGMQSLDVAGPLDVFAEANGFVGIDDGYDLTLIAEDLKPLQASNGMLIAPHRSFREAEKVYDMVLVAGGPALPHAEPDPALTRWLADIAPRCPQYGSICTGAFALGHAGLIDRKNVTTHWQDAPTLARRFPQAHVELDRIYIRDGRLVTSAGVTAGIDLALALVADDHGAETALAVAKRLVVVVQRQGGQSQFSPFLVLPVEPNSPIAIVHAHVMTHIKDVNGVEELAQVAGMSPRTFARAFKDKTKLTPAEFVEGVRIDVARNRLEAGDMPLKLVAFECGFTSSEHMRQVFMRRLGITPSQYRASFAVRPAIR